MKDLILTCVDCGNNFTFTEGEQKFFQNNNLNIPKRCKKCRGEYRHNGLKRSSFFENAKTYGMPENVSGGLDVEYIYYIKSPQKGFLAYKNNKFYFVKERNGVCLCTRNRAKAEKYCLEFNQKYNTNCQLWPLAFYVGRNIY